MSAPGGYAMPSPRRLSLITAFQTFNDDLSTAFDKSKDRSPISPVCENSFEGPPPPPPSPVGWAKQDYMGKQKAPGSK